MSQTIFQTITGRNLPLGDLNDDERRFLTAVQERYRSEPEWSEFGAWWISEFEDRGLSKDSILYRLCQDLEARLGIAQKKVARPDYRDSLADLIEEKFGSRYRFCQETGVDPGHLSRVLASRADLSIQTLQKILDELHFALVIRPEEDVEEAASPQRAARKLALAAAV